MSKDLYFSPYTRTRTNYTPSLICSRALDKFTVSSTKGNGALTYPVGLISSDEVMYAGGVSNTSNNRYYLYTDQYYWTLSPYEYSLTYADGIIVSSSGGTSFNSVYNNYGIRPVISLKSTDVVVSGDGTSTNPYVIKTN